MPIEKISIDRFIELSGKSLVLDVRSPGEYLHAHVPGACNLPLFNDEERKLVGTTYKQQSRETAIKIGLDFFGVKMRKMVEEAESLLLSRFPSKQTEKTGAQNGELKNRNILIHCWRGGMRSAAVAWLLDLYGYQVFLLVGGYKAYRKWVLAQFERTYDFSIIGGYTGSGKTPVLHELQHKGQTIIDLEGLACHKGSAFGALGEKEQPRQEMFENLLADKLNDAARAVSVIWLEDESQRIGNLQIPMPLWYTMRKCPVYFLDIPFDQRLDYLTEEYGKFEKEKLVNAVIRIQKRLGGLETKNAIGHLLENDHRECFRILLHYYDKWYTKGLNNREGLPALLNNIPCTGVDVQVNTQKIMTCNTVSAS